MSHSIPWFCSITLLVEILSFSQQGSVWLLGLPVFTMLVCNFHIQSLPHLDIDCVLYYRWIFVDTNLDWISNVTIHWFSKLYVFMTVLKFLLSAVVWISADLSLDLLKKNIPQSTVEYIGIHCILFSLGSSISCWQTTAAWLPFKGNLETSISSSSRKGFSLNVNLH